MDIVINGTPQTEKKIGKFPLVPNVLRTSVIKWKKIPETIPMKILKNWNLARAFLIESEQPSITIVIKIKGKEIK